MRNITELPEDCLEHILSLTSPKDVLRSLAVVSKQFLSVSNSDALWARFLPSDCEDIVSGSSISIPRNQFGSKKALFVYLPRFPILLDNNTKSFALDKWSGKTCYMLGARALSIVWGSTPEYWTWESIPGSRFPECAVLKYVCWLHIRGNIHTALLSPNTTYGVYFVFKVDGGSSFESVPVKVSLLELGEDGLPINDHHALEMLVYLKATSSEGSSLGHYQRLPGGLPVARSDGWMEIEMGTYLVGANNKVEGQRPVLEITLKEVEKLHWKCGLSVNGIELRPLR